MEDLLASIRKIIADDHERPRPTLRAVPPMSSREPPPRPAAPDTEPDLSDLVERSMLDAFGIADAEADIDEPRRHEPEADDAPGSHDDEIAIEAAVNSIAAAIAAERQSKRRREDPAPAAWDDVVLGEPDLDAAPRPERPEHPEVRPAAPDAAVAKGAAARVASLKARYETAERAARPSAEPLPSNVYRLEPEQRTHEMTDAAVDPKTPEGEGNVFRRPDQRRAELDDGLTSARTRQNVSSALDNLSRTIINSNPRTLEDLVRDMVRPLLREWLEANLSDIVERQVRQEIDRVSTRGR